MCIAIHRPGGVHIKKHTLETCFDSNPHGAGFAYPTRNGLRIVKGLMTFDDFWKQYRKYPGKPMLIHFRWATHGTRGPEMTHPFGVVIEDKVEFALIHNGIIHASCVPYSRDKSDTCLFTELIAGPVLTAMVGRPMPTKPLATMIEETVGSGNKILIMDRNGKVCIAHESQGTKDLGCWFSNTQYKSIISRKKNRRVQFDTEEEWNEFLEAQRESNVMGYQGAYRGNYVADRNGANRSRAVTGNQLPNHYQGNNLPAKMSVYHHRIHARGTADLSPCQAFTMLERYRDLLGTTPKTMIDAALIEAGCYAVAAESVNEALWDEAQNQEARQAAEAKDKQNETT